MSGSRNRRASSISRTCSSGRCACSSATSVRLPPSARSTGRSRSTSTRTSTCSSSAARALARRERRALRRRRRLPVDLRVHGRRAGAPARCARALPAGDDRAARGELPLDPAGAGAREPPRTAARRCGEGAAADARRRPGAGGASVCVAARGGRRDRRGDPRLAGAARGDRDPLPHERAPDRFRRGAARGAAPVPGLFASRPRRRAAADAPPRAPDGAAAADAVRAAALDAGWLEELPEKLGERELVRQTDLARLVSLAAGFDGDAAAFVAELRRRFDPGGDGARGVKLLTLHRAKGLEFDTVFLPRLEEKELPSRQARTPAEIDEERRLLYVGMTRAKRMLWLTLVGQAVAVPRRARRRGATTRSREQAPQKHAGVDAAPENGCARGGSSVRARTASRRTSSSTTRCCTRSRRPVPGRSESCPRSRASAPRSSSATATRCCRRSSRADPIRSVSDTACPAFPR